MFNLNTMKVLVFGNALVKQDNLALRLIPKLQKAFPEIEFKDFDPTENLEDEILGFKLKILDVVEGIDKVIKITDLNQLRTDKVYSMHDFDLGFNLKLLEKIGKLKEVEIIGLPQNMSESKALREIMEMLQKSIEFT